MLAVDEEASHGSDEPLCPPGDGGQLHEPMCQRETVSLMVQLFFGDRPPQSIDDGGRIMVDLLDRAVEVFCPQRESAVARASIGSQVAMLISVSLNRECSLRLAEPTVSHRSSTIATLARPSSINC